MASIPWMEPHNRTDDPAGLASSAAAGGGGAGSAGLLQPEYAVSTEVMPTEVIPGLAVQMLREQSSQQLQATSMALTAPNGASGMQQQQQLQPRMSAAGTCQQS